MPDDTELLMRALYRFTRVKSLPIEIARRDGQWTITIGSMPQGFTVTTTDALCDAAGAALDLWRERLTNDKHATVLG